MTGPHVLVAHPGAELYGSDRMVLESVRGMVERGWRVTVTLPVEGPLVAELLAAGAAVVRTPTPVLRKSLLSPLGLLRLTRACVTAAVAGRRLIRERRPDVVYVSTLTVPMWLLLARVLGLPSVCHVHEAEGSAPAHVRRALVSPLLLATTVVANSQYSVEVLARSSASVGRRATVVYNGVEGPPEPTPPRADLDGQVRLVYTGRLSPRKGVRVAVDALGDLLSTGVDATLDVVGAVFPGYEWFERELAELAVRRGIEDRLVLHGFVDDVWPLLARADVVLVPSTVDEPFGNTAVEALLAARPLVVSDTSGLREAADGFASVHVVPPGDPAALAGAVRAVVAGWPRVSRAAFVDAADAARRYAPERYRDEVSAAVAAVARTVEEGGVDTRPAPARVAPDGVRLVVAVATYRRPTDLEELLPQLVGQCAASPARAGVLVVDNDPDAGARELVARYAERGVRYVHEAEPGISAARNRALDESGDADLLVFVDDDERPVEGWLDALVETWRCTGADAVVGPVVSEFDVEPDAWVSAGRFFDRRRLATGTRVDVAATNNLLLDLRRIDALTTAAGRGRLRFDATFGLSGGSDTLYTRTVHRLGGTLVWCDEALVVDRVPAARVTRRWVVTRALRSGNSWSRTSLHLEASRAGRAGGRLRLTGEGGTRLAGGVARVGLGVLSRDPSHRVRGVRTAARGAGMLLGAYGYTYSEYRRPRRGTRA